MTGKGAQNNNAGQLHDLTRMLTVAGVEFERLGSGREIEFKEVRPLDEAGPDDLVFVNKPSDGTPALLKAIPTRIVLIEKKWALGNEAELKALDKSLFLVDNPRLVIAGLLTALHPAETQFVEGIHPTAIIDPAADIHPTVAIGPYCIIGKCKLGEGSIIGAHTIIKDDVFIGRNVTIRESCMVGSAGFGFVKDEEGIAHRLPHMGRVEIGDNVDIFPFCNIDRGTLGATRIGAGTKLAQYVHIGHNTTTGPNCLITSMVVLCGGSKVGASCWLGIGCILKEKVVVGSNVTIGIGAVVVKDVADGLTVAGVPARVMIKN
jgi:UDP-3-O-[3-hydroxymyristoyl] glucosamine N-acyltransferase